MWKWVSRVLPLALLMVRTVAAPFNRSLTHCVFDTRPHVSCGKDAIYGLGPIVANTIETSVSNTYPNMTCLEDRSMVLDMLATCQCDVGIGDFQDAIYDLVKATSIRTSYPYHPSAYGVIKRQQPWTSTMWGIFLPFTPGLWALVIITPAALAIFMTYFSWVISKYKNSRFSLGLLPQYTLQNSMSFLNEPTQVEYMDWHGKSGFMLTLKFCLQTMLVSYAFLCLVITSVYTAQLTNILLRREMLQEQSTFSEAVKQTQSLVIPAELKTFFQTQYNREASLWYQNSTEEMVVQLDRLRQGEIDGLVTPVEAGLWAIQTQNDDCALNMNPNAYHLTTGQVFLYSPCVDQEEIATRDRIILNLAIRGVLASQADLALGSYSTGSRPVRCVNRGSEVTIRDVAGAWIIVAAAVLLPLLFTVGRYSYYLLKKCINTYGGVFNINTPETSFKRPRNDPTDSGARDLESNGTNAQRHRGDNGYVASELYAPHGDMRRSHARGSPEHPRPYGSTVALPLRESQDTHRFGVYSPAPIRTSGPFEHQTSPRPSHTESIADDDFMRYNRARSEPAVGERPPSTETTSSDDLILSRDDDDGYVTT